MGPVDSVPLDEALGNTNRDRGSGGSTRTGRRLVDELIVVLFAAVIFLGCIVSPPSLMDDVDAVQAQIARNMLQSGDWVTARLDGVAYLEKSPLKYWMMAVSFAIFGAHDWAARIPIALSTVLLCWVTARFGGWAFGRRVGLHAGLVLGTSVGLFLFTRILIPDVMLTLAITIALWGMMRALEEEERHPAAWAMAMWAAIGTGLLLKGLIAAAFPVATGLLYLGLTKQLLLRRTWRRLQVMWGMLLALGIAAPWHVLATLRNPPYFDFTMHSEKGSYHGFFWFYFINEHVLRFLNLRYPRDYNTVPRVYFWLFHLLWLFPWTAFIPEIRKLSFRPTDRGGRMRQLAACWIGFILIFFTFSTTQEYYSMPCYPAMALLLGSAVAAGGAWITRGTRALTVIAGLAAAAIVAILVLVRNVPSPGDISAALSSHPGAYTLSLGHMEDLTLQSFAYLRLPLALAAVAFCVGMVGTLRARSQGALIAVALMMVLFFQAARLAMVAFDPFLSSRPIAEVLNRSPQGTLIVDHHYYWFSSAFFYTNRRALLLNARVDNLVYGSYAPDAPEVFIDDAKFRELWTQPDLKYFVARDSALPRLQGLVGAENLHLITVGGGKVLLANQLIAPEKHQP